jgi:hypothetical protein
MRRYWSKLTLSQVKKGIPSYPNDGNQKNSTRDPKICPRLPNEVDFLTENFLRSTDPFRNLL